MISPAVNIVDSSGEVVSGGKPPENQIRLASVESKMNGTLSKIEKEKCVWYLKNEIFSKILIAKKGEKRGGIEYLNFKEKFPKFFK